jgi:hypothetical protein
VDGQDGEAEQRLVDGQDGEAEQRLVDGQDGEEEQQHERHSGEPYGVAGTVIAKSAKLATPDGETTMSHMGTADVPADIAGRSRGDYRYSHRKPGRSLFPCTSAPVSARS